MEVEGVVPKLVAQVPSQKPSREESHIVPSNPSDKEDYSGTVEPYQLKNAFLTKTNPKNPMFSLKKPNQTTISPQLHTFK